MRILFLALSLTGSTLAQMTAASSSVQSLITYTASSANQCKIEVSTSNTYSPLVPAVDATIFSGANMDGQTTNGSRAFLVGKRAVLRENVSAPAVTLGVGEAAKTGNGNSPNQVTVTHTGIGSSFVAGDNITVASCTDTSYNDTWARVNTVSTNSLTYEALAAPSGASTGSCVITRANQYSLALQPSTTYYVRIGQGSTCSASASSLTGSSCTGGVCTGTFTTSNIPNGSTWSEPPILDSSGNNLMPSIPEDRTKFVTDPITGARIGRVSLYSDMNASADGWSSAFYRASSMSQVNGGYHLTIGNGASPGNGNSYTSGLYHICATAAGCSNGTAFQQATWLGWMHVNYTDSNGKVCCNTGTAYYSANTSTADNSNANIYYGIFPTNRGDAPYKNVIVSSTYTGNDVAAATSANWAVNPAVELTASPSSTLDDLMTTYVNFDSDFDVNKFHAAALNDVEGNYLTGWSQEFQQGSPTWNWIYNKNTGAIVAMGSIHKNPQTRWCGSHGTTVDGSQKWLGFSTSYLVGNQTGEYHLQLGGSLTNVATSTTVKSLQAWQSATAYNSGATVGFAVLDNNGNIQVATTTGTSGGSAPTWNVTVGGTTADNTIVWTNIGAGTGEPENLYPFTDNNGNKYSHLQAAAGATGGGGTYNGDLFVFTDGTGEQVRLITKGACTSGTCTWSSITRGVNGTTAQAHSSGAGLRTMCEEGEVTTHAIHYWDFIDDPHMTDTTNTYYVRVNASAGHGYAREYTSGVWNTGDVYNQAPWVASDFTGNPNLQMPTSLTFNSITTSSDGVGYQDYVTPGMDASPGNSTSIGSRYFLGGAGILGSYALVGGKTKTYKYTLGSTPFNKTLPYVSVHGLMSLQDISGTGSSLPDDGSNKVCLASVANECITGSSPGDIYATLASVDGAGICNSSGENSAYTGADWCLLNTSTYGNVMGQYGMTLANVVGTDGRGVTKSGAGKSRAIAATIPGAWRLQAFHPHTTADGQFALFESCAADPHLNTKGGSSNGNLDIYGCHIFSAVIPAQPSADAIDRTNYIAVPVTYSNAAAYARVRYGYEENEPTKSSTYPPPMHYYATQYQGESHSACVAANQTVSLAIGVPQRMLFYQPQYFSDSGCTSLTSSGAMTVVAVDATGSSPAGGSTLPGGWTIPGGWVIH